MRTIYKGAIALAVAGVATGAWLLEGRYLVEGGRAPWAVINGRDDVLAEALASGIGESEKNEALRHATSRGKIEALKMLLAAGASPNAMQGSRCQLSSATRFGRINVAAVLLEAGADPKLCDVDAPTMMQEMVTYGHGDTPEHEIIWAMSLLMAADVDAAPNRYATAVAEAKKLKLAQVVAFLEDPIGNAPTRPADTTGTRSEGKAGSLDLDDLKTVCTGKALEDAAPYVLQEGQAAQVYYFERRNEEFRWPGRGPDSPSLPKWWTSWDDPSHTQLVACVDAVEKQRVETCSYEGSGGGISTYEATYTMTVYEAKTGKVLDTKTLPKKPAPKCPMVKSGEQQEGLYPLYSEDLQAFLAPHVGGPK